jgi:hypothetical protein
MLKHTLLVHGLVVAGLVSTALAAGQMRVTEYMYKGNGGEFMEFTNVGDAPVDMTGWSYDDDSATPGVVSLSGFGVVAPGESVILTEDTVTVFHATWNVPGVKIIGDNTVNIGGSDQINLFDAGGVLVDRITYGATPFPGSIVTSNISGYALAEALGDDDIYGWVLSNPGDVQGSVISSFGDLASPGRHLNLSPNVTSYGSGCAGSGGFVPSLIVEGAPVAGETLTLSVKEGLGGSTALLFLGTSQVALPMAGGCTLNVAPLLPVVPALPLSGAAAGEGEIRAALTVPTFTTPVTLTMQAFVVDGNVPRGFANSNGVEIVFP